MARRLCAATAAPNCDIFTVQGETLRCVCSIARGVADPDYVGTEYPLAQLGLAGLALESRQPLVAEDLANDPRVSAFERDEYRRWGHQAALDLPLISRGEVIGLAEIHDDHPRDFERLDYLHSLAQVAAAAVKDELVDKAAWAMYLVKRRGRNKVMAFSAEHGGETPEQAALVSGDHVAVMGEVVAAREAYRQRRRSAITQVALGVGRDLEVPAEEIHAAIGAAEADEDEPIGPARLIVALATAYQELVAERPYRSRISEAEALDELLKCPELSADDDLARAFARVLTRPS